MAEEKQTLALHQSGVFYADGSCRPHNPGFIGWGIHGYIYDNSNTGTPLSTEGFTPTTHGYIKIGSDLPQNAQPVIPLEYVDGFGSQDGLHSNNVAEIQALLNLFKFLKTRPFETVRIYTDSEYLKTCMNDWCRRWVKNGWVKGDGQPVNNREWLEPTYKLLLELRSLPNADIQIYWIRSHNGHLGNERADILAGIGMNHSQARLVDTKIVLSPVKGYWKADIERNPYIAFRRLYFNTVKDYHRPGVYHIAESTDTDFIVGKPSASSGYSVIYLKDPDPIIEKIKEKQFENSRGLNVVVLMKLDSVYSKYVYPWLEEHGNYALIGQKNSHSMSMVNKTPITVEMNPVGLSLRALDYFAMLEELLLNFQETRRKNDKLLIGATPVEVTEITDKFFKIVLDKKGHQKFELLEEFIVGYKNHNLNIEYTHAGKPIPVKIPYVLGYDCLPRNNLKYLENANPKIYLLTWREGSILRYATIIESDLGSGIWSNYFANQILLPTEK